VAARKSADNSLAEPVRKLTDYLNLHFIDDCRLLNFDC
jgi:hypothetical protein